MKYGNQLNVIKNTSAKKKFSKNKMTEEKAIPYKKDLE